jgi:hypothetical protein
MWLNLIGMTMYFHGTFRLEVEVEAYLLNWKVAFQVYRWEDSSGRMFCFDVQIKQFGRESFQ